jgi:CBS domain-containing protein
MKHAGVRSAFVIDEKRRVVVGLVTAYDITGDKPVRHMQLEKLKRHQVLVRDIMHAIEDWRVADVRDVEHATVAQVARMFDESGFTHLPVVEPDGNGSSRLRGLLSAARGRRVLAR